jgi:cytochrome c peroxidase
MLRIRPVRSAFAGLIALCLTAGVTAAHGMPLGLPPDDHPDDAHTQALAALGQQLFNDKRLSADGTISCASCHSADKGFTDGLPTAHGLHGQQLTRRTPSLLNVRFAPVLFWDGRAPDLTTQVRAPLLAPAEHGLRDEQAVGTILSADPGYASAFEHLFGIAKDQISLREASSALAAYERTLVAADSPFDRYQYGGNPKALSAAASRGLELFRGRAQCATCHLIGTTSALLTDGQFHSSPLQLPASTQARLGTLAHRISDLRAKHDLDNLNALIATDADAAELGRFVVTLDPKDIGRFRTPSLRNVAVTGPYMHNGSVESLSQAVDLELYGRTAQRYPLVLTEDERTALLEFLRALTSS